MKSSIECFKNFLAKFSRNNCPQKYYTAWKVLILGTNEYNGREEQIINYAYDQWLRTKYFER